MTRSPHFFRQHLVTRKPLGNEGAKHPLAGEVDFGYEIDPALLVDLYVAAESIHHDVAGPHDGLDGRGEKDGIERHSGLDRISGSAWRLDTLGHEDFHPALRGALETDIVHETADEKNATAAGFEEVLGRHGVGDASRDRIPRPDPEP